MTDVVKLESKHYYISLSSAEPDKVIEPDEAFEVKFKHAVFDGSGSVSLHLLHKKLSLQLAEFKEDEQEMVKFPAFKMPAPFRLRLEANNICSVNIVAETVSYETVSVVEEQPKCQLQIAAPPLEENKDETSIVFSATDTEEKPQEEKSCLIDTPGGSESGMEKEEVLDSPTIQPLV